jgi:hypothetical protein
MMGDKSMKSALVLMATLVFSTTVGAEDATCPTGSVWTVAPVQSGEKVNDHYLILGSGGKTYRICNCSTDAPNGYYIQMKAVLAGSSDKEEDERTVSTRLHKSSCLITDSHLVWVQNTNKTVTAHGTIEVAK